jgi:hypothetical protein
MFLFKKRIKPKQFLPFSDSDLTGVIQANRTSLQLIDNWIDDEAFSKSFFNYGVPDFIKTFINKEIDNQPTYTDLLSFIGKKYFEKVDYLEIGVSVGKNFFQLIRGLDNASFTGFDIEEINPVIENKLVFEHKSEWETPQKSIKKDRSSLKRYYFQQKKVSYLSGDIWDVQSWSNLRGNKYNIVFSDALHTPQAILFEFEMLVANNLLDERFVIVWDDLVGKMQKSFHKIIQKYHETFGIQDVYLLNVNGWVGQYEEPHSVGIISNFRL